MPRSTMSAIGSIIRSRSGPAGTSVSNNPIVMRDAKATPGRQDRWRADGRRALAGAFACVVLLGLMYVGSFHVAFFQRADQKMFVGFYDLTYLYYRPGEQSTIASLVGALDVSPYVYLALLPIALASARRWWSGACAVAVTLVGANLTTLVLKMVLPEPRTASLLGIASPVPYPRWPSGHATAAMALVLALVLAAPARLRIVAAGAGAVLASAVGYSLLALGSHLLSDVFAGFLVAAAWSLLALAGVRVWDGPLPVAQTRSTGEARSRWQAVVAAAAALVASVLSARFLPFTSTSAALSYARAHQASFFGVVALAFVSTAMTAALALALRTHKR
jgi:membrane-associated phospholipid phosphatase